MLHAVHPGISARAWGKINLHLGVGALREDGYHDLNSVFQTVSIADVVTVAQGAPGAAALTVETTGAFAGPRPGDDPSNLAARAVELVADRVRADGGTVGPLEIRIDKRLPVAGGMAGGSADAAAALIAANEHLRADLSRAELTELAGRLGADVPFVLHGGTALGVERGDRLMPVLCRGEYWWVLVFNNAGLSTPRVFAKLDEVRGAATVPDLAHPDALLQALAAGDPRRVAAALHNDLQPAAVSLLPGLRRTLRAGTEAGALAGLVSGSGPTCAFLTLGRDDAVSIATEMTGMGVAGIRIAYGPGPGATTVPIGTTAGPAGIYDEIGDE